MNKLISKEVNDWDVLDFGEFRNNIPQDYSGDFRNNIPQDYSNDYDRIMFQKINITKNKISILINPKRITLNLYKQESLIDCIFNCMTHCDLYFYIFKCVVKFLKQKIFDFMGGNIFEKLRKHLLTSDQKIICFHMLIALIVCNWITQN